MVTNLSWKRNSQYLNKKGVIEEDEDFDADFIQGH